jgi:hypothetical protein
MRQGPFLAFFFEPIRRNSDAKLTGTETFTEAREDPDRDVEASEALGTETFTRSRGEDGDKDMANDNTAKHIDSPGIWETTIL